jgi:hypothetical protein
MTIQDIRTYTGQAAQAEPQIRIRINEELHPRWAHCDMVSRYLGRVTGTQDIEGLAEPEVAELGDSVNYVSNELLENAIKERSGGSIEVCTRAQGHGMTLVVSNHIAAAKSEKFRGSLGRLFDGESSLEEKFFATMEHNEAHPDAKVSGLGFLTMMIHHGADLSWRFESGDGAEGGRVSVSAVLSAAGHEGEV